jgi:hypothetical protein
MPRENIHVSARFRIAVESTILQLERDAAHDERLLPLLSSPDHRRRQRLLVQQQLDKAFRLRELLSLISHRTDRAA